MAPGTDFARILNAAVFKVRIPTLSTNSKVVHQGERSLRSSIKAYALGIILLAGVVLLRWLLDPLLGDTFPLVTLYGAVAATIWFGGYRPAILVAILGYLAGHYWFIQPRGHFDLSNSANVVGLIAYLFTCTLIIAFGEATRISHGRVTQQGELLRVTLESIGDAVITTDTGGRITYLNKVAEALTGWLQQDALGQPLENVFRIVNEATGQPVESPATRALREGRRRRSGEPHRTSSEKRQQVSHRRQRGSNSR
jgi:PAS domain S-box-containing protein